jgi:fructose-1-phosphate kinase PfkB-like protein
MVHLNKKEVCDTYGVDTIEKGIAALVKDCDYAAVTDGSKGLYLANTRSQINASCTVDKEKVYSAVGCGDCLTAGLVVAFVANKTTEDIAKMAVACGAANCLRQDLGMLYQKDVNELIALAVVN